MARVSAEAGRVCAQFSDKPDESLHCGHSGVGGEQQRGQRTRPGQPLHPGDGVPPAPVQCPGQERQEESTSSSGPRHRHRHRDRDAGLSLRLQDLRDADLCVEQSPTRCAEETLLDSPVTRDWSGRGLSSLPHYALRGEPDLW